MSPDVASTTVSGRSGLELGVLLTHANDLLGQEFEHLIEIAVILDEAGIDYVSVADHVVLGATMEGHEALGGALPFPQDEPYPDPLIVLAAIATSTNRVRLATGILIAPLRPAVLLAKMAATLSVISKGRLDLGVGSGWQLEEFNAVGVPIDEKVRRLDEGMEACCQLWSTSLASFESKSVSFKNVACSPRPSSGEIPIWFAGKPVPVTLRRVARLGRGWLPLGLPTLDQLAIARRQLNVFCDELERDSSTIGIRVGLPTARDNDGRANVAATLGSIDGLVEAGATGVQLNIRDFAQSTTQLGDVVTEIRSLV